MMCFLKWFPGRVDALADVAEDVDVATVVGRGRGRRRVHVDALSNDTGDKEIPTTVGRNLRRGHVGGKKYFVLQYPQL
jgi:hypothetical protein